MNLLKINEEDKNKIRRIFEVSEQDINKCVEVIKKWINQEPDLPNDILDDGAIESILLRNKFRLEQTKRKIETYFAFKVAYQDMYSDFEKQKPSEQFILNVAFPKLTSKGERIVYFKLVNSNPMGNDIKSFVTTAVTMGDIMTRYDYSASQIFVINLEGLTFNLVRKIPISLAHKSYKLKEAFSGRISGIHFLNASTFISSVVSIAKLILPEKVVNRIKIHQDFTSVFEDIPAELFPKDLGGTLSTLDELARAFDELHEENIPVIKRSLEQISNSSIINKFRYPEDQYGISGTFKQLNLD